MAGAGPFLLTAAVLGSAAGVNSAAPIRLEVETASGQDVIRVIAESAAPCTATYELDVSQGRGGNTSANRGTVQLTPGKRQTVATVRVAIRASAPTTVRLVVSPCGGATYEQRWPAS